MKHQRLVEFLRFYYFLLRCGAELGALSIGVIGICIGEWRNAAFCLVLAFLIFPITELE